MAPEPGFLKAKVQVLNNLETIQNTLELCTDQGMLDVDDALYNELLNIMEEGEIAKNFTDLEQVIARGKDIEYNLETWLALHGGNSIELSWPTQKPSD